jgi:xanthine/uracil/vitamin C permease (AzgA family)
MSTAAAIVSALLAAILAAAAVRKLSHREEVVQTYIRVGVPRDKLDYLAYILLAGAAGLVLGLFWAPIGIAAGIGVVCYFVLAVVAHIRHHDERNLPTPLVIEALAVAALTLRVASL